MPKNTSLKLTFDIDCPSEPEAGLYGYTETVTVEVESGNPGGLGDEFSEYMRDCLSDWFDYSNVSMRKP